MNYLINRTNTYQSTHEDKDQELRIREIMKNDYFHQQIMYRKQKHKLLTSKLQTHKNQKGPSSHIAFPTQEKSQNY
jgi:hypothetical protein